jgi:hypothetical protein
MLWRVSERDADGRQHLNEGRSMYAAEHCHGMAAMRRFMHRAGYVQIRIEYLASIEAINGQSRNRSAPDGHCAQQLDEKNDRACRWPACDDIKRWSLASCHKRRPPTRPRHSRTVLRWFSHLSPTSSSRSTAFSFPQMSLSAQCTLYATPSTFVYATFMP